MRTITERLIVAKLRNVKRLENKENRVKNSCEILTKKEAKYREIIPLADLIWDLHISKNELMSFKIAVNEWFPPVLLRPFMYSIT
jgi:hypothetical protein